MPALNDSPHWNLAVMKGNFDDFFIILLALSRSSYSLTPLMSESASIESDSRSHLPRYVWIYLVPARSGETTNPVFPTHGPLVQGYC